MSGALSAPVVASRALGPLIGSFVWSSFGNYDAVLWMLAAFALLAVVSFYFTTHMEEQVRGAAAVRIEIKPDAPLGRLSFKHEA